MPDQAGYGFMLWAVPRFRRDPRGATPPAPAKAAREMAAPAGPLPRDLVEETDDSAEDIAPGGCQLA